MDTQITGRSMRAWRQRWISRKSLGMLSAVLIVLMVALPLRSEPKPVYAYLTAPQNRKFTGGTGIRGCTDCHQIDATFSHPVNFKPKHALPKQFPLDNGTMTCVTCHADVIENGHSRPEQSKQTSAKLCVQCHAGDPSDARFYGHGMGVSRAHLRWSGRSAAPLAVSSAKGSLDGESRNCLSCHDGSSATDVQARRSELFKTVGSSHPVGIPVRPTAADGSSIRSMIDSRLHLENGTIGCNTCHSPYSKEKGLLVMNNQGSTLCFACHQF